VAARRVVPRRLTNAELLTSGSAEPLEAHYVAAPPKVQRAIDDFFRALARFELRQCLCGCGRFIHPSRRRDAEYFSDACRKRHARVCEVKGHKTSCGTCERCGAMVLKPRSRMDIKSRLYAERGYMLRTRRRDDPTSNPRQPEPVPASDAEQKRRFALGRERRGMSFDQWLNRVAPSPEYLPRPDFERTSDWKPACRSGQLEAVDHTAGPAWEDVFGVPMVDATDEEADRRWLMNSYDTGPGAPASVVELGNSPAPTPEQEELDLMMHSNENLCGGAGEGQ
jgi:hypothetical protein